MASDYEGVIILGFPRSGTTLLRRLINSHPQFACPSETNLLSAASKFLDEQHVDGGISIGVVPGLGFSGYDESTVLTRLREFVFGFFAECSTRDGKPKWAEKTAVDIFHIDAIERLCGDRCRYICIFRHPLDVVCSVKELSEKMDCYLPEIHDFVREHRSPLTAFAHAWYETNKRLIQFINENPLLCVEVKYEQLVNDPKKQLENIFEFLCEPTDVDELLTQAFGPVGSVGLGDWKTYDTRSISSKGTNRHKELSKWTVKQLWPIVEEIATNFGYQVDFETHAGDANDERRILELRRRIYGMKLASNQKRIKDD